MTQTKLMSLTAAVHAATGETFHRATVARWATEGIGGVRLRSWRVGGRRLTNIVEVIAFVRATSDIDAPALPEVSRAS